MKSRFFQISILLAAFSVVSFQAAFAQEQRGARFNFAPNVWKSEEAKIPHSPYAAPVAVHAVKHGSMPKSSNFLLDPNMMPTPVQQVAIAPATTQLSHQISIPKTSFKPSFGKPLSAPPMQLASLPLKAPAISAAPVKAAKHAISGRHIHTGVNGRIASRPHSSGHSAGVPVAASYGKNFGYQPGGYLPTQTGSGTTTSSEVSGRVIRH